MSVRDTQATARDGRVDFDFLMGRWQIHNRRLRERLKRSDSWEEFESTSEARPVLGGLGNVDEYTMDRELGRFQGVICAFTIPRHRSGASIGPVVTMASCRRR